MTQQLINKDLESATIQAWNFGSEYGITCHCLEREAQEADALKECGFLLERFNTEQREEILACFWEGYAFAEARLND